MTASEFQEFRERDVLQYAEANVRAGSWEFEWAVERSREEYSTLLPNGLDTPSHHLCAILDPSSGARVGEVWYAIQESHGRKELFVYWIGIRADLRRRGYASATIGALDKEAQTLGAKRISLNVFGDNAPAISLYRRLGFAPISYWMGRAVRTP